MKLYSFIIFSLLLSACTKEPLPPKPKPCDNPPCDTTKPMSMTLELLWQIPLRLDKDYTVSDACPITPDYAVFRYDAVEQEKLLFVHKSDTSHARFFGPNEGNYLNVFYHPWVGIIAMDAWSVFTGQNAASMKKLATVPPGLQFQVNYNLYGDYVYGNLGYWNAKQQYIFRMNVYSGVIEYLRTIDHADCPECELILVVPPVLFELNNGNVIMSYFISYAKTVPGDIRRVLQEISLVKGSEIIPLRVEENPLINYWKESVIVYKDNWIVTTRDSIYCIEPLSNRKLWVRENKKIDNAYPVNGTDKILIGNKIISILEGHYTEINADNGDMYVGEKVADGGIESQISYYNGVVYWGTKDQAYSWIYGIRISDRKLVVRMRSPNWNKPPYYDDAIFDRRGLVIDPESGLGYTHDGFFAQCYKLL